MPVVCTYCLEESRRLLANAGAATKDVTWCLSSVPFNSIPEQLLLLQNIDVVSVLFASAMSI